MEFVKEASLMKEVADIQAETDMILKMVANAATVNYLEKEKHEEEEKDGNNQNKKTVKRRFTSMTFICIKYLYVLKNKYIKTVKSLQFHCINIV